MNKNANERNKEKQFAPSHSPTHHIAFGQHLSGISWSQMSGICMGVAATLSLCVDRFKCPLGQTLAASGKRFSPESGAMFSIKV